MARPFIPFREAVTMTFSGLAKDCLRWLDKTKGYSPRTQIRYETTYFQFRAFLLQKGLGDDWRHFERATVQAFSDRLGVLGAHPNTIVVNLAALSTLARFAMQRTDERGRSLLATNPTRAFEWPQRQIAETKYLRGDELRAFLAIEVPTWMALPRALALETGLRASELCRANVGDLHEVKGQHYLAVRVKGAGRRDDVLDLPLSPGLVEAIREALLAAGRVRADDPILVNSQSKRFERTTLTGMFARIGTRAGITRFQVTSHTLRHTMNVIARLSGLDPAQRSRLLTHSSPRTLARYDHLVPGELHQARAHQVEGLARYIGFGQPTEPEGSAQNLGEQKVNDVTE